MRWVGQHPTESQDRGAVAVFFSILLVVLLGFVGVGVDLASVYAKSQEVQNGADAAALAVAQQCTGPTGCSGDVVLAQELAERNVRLQVDTVETAVSYPSSNKVRVVAQADHQNAFLGLFGQNTFQVKEAATVMWGTPVAGRAALPITISQCSFSKRVSGVDVPLDGVVSIWMDHPSDPYGHGCYKDYPPGGFGWLDPDGGKCESWVELAPSGTYGMGPSKTGTPNPGECNPGADHAFKRAVDAGEPVLIPIFTSISGSGTNATYHISRFAAFELMGYDIHNKVGEYGTKCASKPDPSAKSCLVGKFVKYVSLDDDMDLVTPPPGDKTTVIRMSD